MISVTMVKPSVWDNCRILSVDWAEEKIIFNEHIDLVDKNSHEKQLEEKQKIIDEQLEIIRKIALTGDGSHKDKHASFYDCLSTLQLEFSERVEHAREYLKRMEE